MRRPLVASLVLVSFVLMFQNCAKSGSDPQASAADGGGGTGSTGSEILSLYTTSGMVTTNSTTQIMATGGTAPYQYAIASGAGSIDASSGLYTAPSYATAVTVMATDSAGNFGQLDFSVYDSSGGTGGGSGAFCGVFPISSNATCRGARNGSCSVTVSFGSQIPSNCRIKRLTITANHFNASYGSCATPAYFSLTSSGQKVSGTTAGKGHSLTVNADLTSKSFVLTSSVAGYGDCGGNPCNACITDVTYEVTTEAN